MDSINNTTCSTTTSSNSNIPTQLPNSIQMDSINNTTTTTTEQQAQTSIYTYKTISSAPPKRRAGRTKFRETRHPVFKGVRQRGGGEGGSSRPERWVCEVREPNNKSRLWLGTFPTPEMAARAHDVAAMALRGRSACLNFADSAWRLPVPESSGREEIQRAAVVAAEMFRPKAGAEEVVTSASASASATATATADSQEESKPGLVSGVSPTCSMLDLKMEEFGGDHHCWDTDIATGLLDSGGITGSSCYYWDDYAVDTSSNDCSVADYEVSLWSYSI